MCVLGALWNQPCACVRCRHNSQIKDRALRTKGRFGLFVAAASALLMAYFYLFTRLSNPNFLDGTHLSKRFLYLYLLPLLLTAVAVAVFRLWREALRYRIFAVLFCIVAPVLCLLLFAFISCATSPCI